MIGRGGWGATFFEDVVVRTDCATVPLLTR